MTKNNSFAQLLTASGFVVSLFIIGLMFKVIHWPYSTELLIISFALMAILNVVAIMFVKKSTLLNEMVAALNAKQQGKGNLLPMCVIAALLSVSILCVGILFKMMLFPGSGVIIMTGALTLAFCVLVIGVFAGMAYRE